MTADLASWLLADDGPIAEDERVAEAALARTRRWPKGDRPWERHAALGEKLTGASGVLDRMAAMGNPDRVLSECAAKRRIIKAHRLVPPSENNPTQYPAERWGCRVCSSEAEASSWVHPDGPCATLLALASVYAGRPGWREEWAL